MMQKVEMKEAVQDQVTQVTPTSEIKASVVMMQTSEDETPIMNTMASADTNSGIDPGEQIETIRDTISTVIQTSKDKGLIMQTGESKVTLFMPNLENRASMIQTGGGKAIMVQTYENKPTTTASISEDKAPMNIHSSKAKASMVMNTSEDRYFMVQGSGDKPPMIMKPLEDKAVEGKCPMVQGSGDETSMQVKPLEGKAVTAMRNSEGNALKTAQSSADKCSMLVKEFGDTTSVMQASGGNAPMVMSINEDKEQQIMKSSSNAYDCKIDIKSKANMSQCNATSSHYCQTGPTKFQDAGAVNTTCCGLKTVTPPPQVFDKISAGLCGLNRDQYPLPRAFICQTTSDGSSELKNEEPPAEPLGASDSLQLPQEKRPSHTGCTIGPHSCTAAPDVCTFAKFPESKQTSPTEKLEVIIAHYNEDLHWLHPFLKHPDVKVSIYSKGGKNLAPEFHTHTTYLDNIGHEGHTYLYHIVTRYDSLSKIILFCQGDPFNHFHVDYTSKEFLDDALNTPPNSFVTFKGQRMEKFDQWDGINMTDYPILQKQNKMRTKPAARTPAEYWTLLMGPRGYEVPESVGFAPGANFSVQDSMVRQFPRAFWAQFFSEFFLGPMEDINPMTGYICERFWPAILNTPAFSMYPGDIPHIVKHDMRFGRLTRGNWKVLPKDPKEFIPGATPQDLAMALGIDVLDEETARKIHKKREIMISSGETSDSDL